MPNEFVGPEEQLQGLANARWGSVAIVLKSGNPIKLITPGSRFGRGWRAPIVGNLTFVQVRSDAAPFTVIIDGSPTSDGFHVGFNLDAQVRLSPVHDYHALESFIHDRGPSFPDDLLNEVLPGLEAWAFDTTRNFTHSQLRSLSLNQLLAGTKYPITFADGLMEVTSASISNPVWDPRAIEAEEERKSMVVDEARNTRVQASGLAAEETRLAVESARAQVDAQLFKNRWEQFAEIAAESGLPIEAFTMPELYASNREHAFQAAMAMLNPEMRVLWQRKPELIAQMLQAAGLRSVDANSINPAAVTGRNTPAGGPNDQTLALTQLGGGEPGGSGDVLESSGFVIDDLTMDAKLRRTWLRSHPQGSLYGIASGTTNREAVVLVVANDSDAVDEPTRSALAATAGRPAARVVVLPPSDIPGVVRAWFRVVSPSGQGLHVEVTTPDEDTLRIAINGPATSADDALRELKDPENAALPALQNLVPYPVVDLVLGRS